MTFAWYGHLKFKGSPLGLVILASWGIAFFEYCFQVPANRWGSGSYSPFQLKIIQEIITLTVFVVFAAFYFTKNADGIISRPSYASRSGNVRVLAKAALEHRTGANRDNGGFDFLG